MTMHRRCLCTDLVKHMPYFCVIRNVCMSIYLEKTYNWCVFFYFSGSTQIVANHGKLLFRNHCWLMIFSVVAGLCKFCKFHYGLWIFYTPIISMKYLQCPFFCGRPPDKVDNVSFFIYMYPFAMHLLSYTARRSSVCTVRRLWCCEDKLFRSIMNEPR